MSSTKYIDLEPGVWKPAATATGVVTIQLESNTGYVRLYGGDSIPTDPKAPAIRIQSESQLITVAETAKLWAEGVGRIIVMEITTPAP